MHDVEEKPCKSPWEERDVNVVAAALSVIPGLGHLYKGRYLAGLAILLIGVPLGVWCGILLTLATAGIGLLFPIFCWVMVGVDAYFEADRRRNRHPMGIL